MFKSAKIKLTFIYSLISLMLLWLISLGLYMWFAQSLGQGYITEVKQRHQSLPFAEEFGSQNIMIVSIAGNVALEQLRVILIVFNIGFFITIPVIGWFLTGKTLSPIEEANEQQKQFASDASHEMRTPLSIISGEMELALRKDRKIEEYKQTIISSKEEIERLAKLIENLLFLAKGDQGRHQIQFQQVDLTDLLGSLVNSFHLKINQKKLKLVFTPYKKIITVRGQTSMLWTMFSNIIDNAIKYTAQSGKIWININRVDNLALVTIRDNGIGMAARDQAKIFNRFYRADTSRSGEKGFGLGLAISKSIIKLHRGKILIRSTLNKGTTFTIYLPLK